jgi:DNA mismatch repair ATPase MutL
LEAPKKHLEEIVRILLLGGVDIRIKDNQDKTAYDIAKSLENQEFLNAYREYIDVMKKKIDGAALRSFFEKLQENYSFTNIKRREEKQQEAEEERRQKELEDADDKDEDNQSQRSEVSANSNHSHVSSTTNKKKKKNPSKKKTSTKKYQKPIVHIPYEVIQQTIESSVNLLHLQQAAGNTKSNSKSSVKQKQNQQNSCEHLMDHFRSMNDNGNHDYKRMYAQNRPKCLQMEESLMLPMADIAFFLEKDHVRSLQLLEFVGYESKKNVERRRKLLQAAKEKCGADYVDLDENYDF